MRALSSFLYSRRALSPLLDHGKTIECYQGFVRKICGQEDLWSKKI
jgi:hypothetical protein